MLDATSFLSRYLSDWREWHDALLEQLITYVQATKQNVFVNESDKRDGFNVHIDL